MDNWKHIVLGSRSATYCVAFVVFCFLWMLLRLRNASHIALQQDDVERVSPVPLVRFA